MAATQAPAKRRARVVRIVYFRPRLFIAAAIGLVVLAALFMFEPRWRLPTKLLVAWDIGLIVYLMLAGQMLASETARIRSRAKREDEGALALLFLPVAAAGASMVAIFAELASVKGSTAPGLRVVLSVLTVALSWTFIQTLFAFHYAHEFYGEGERANGLIFPECDDPDYWDFAYFAFVIGATFQVSDVQVSNRFIRRIVWAHGVLSFVFNTAILAVTVNVVTSTL